MISIGDSGGEAMPLLADITGPEEMSRAVDHLFEAYGRLDGLCSPGFPVWPALCWREAARFALISSSLRHLPWLLHGTSSG